MKKVFVLLALLVAAAVDGFAQGEKVTLFQKPTISRTHIVFAYGGDLWAVPRAGGDAARLTTGVGIETNPFFSPDGNWIAFTGEYDGNTDVYVIPSAGGIPTRLTYHPGGDSVAGWTPDGKSVLFRSSRNSYSGFNRLFMISPGATVPVEVPLPMANEGSLSPDGSRIAYQPLTQTQPDWKRYRGGQAGAIWVARLSDSSIEKLPRENSNDFNPMWVGDKVYFISDRNGPATLYAYDTTRKNVTQVINNTGLDIKSASAGPDVIAYEQFGTIYLFDPKSGQSQKVNINLAGDLAGVRPRFAKVSGSILSFGISPTGARAVFQARGEILTVPAEKGDVRNLTNTPGVAERYPAWSPDGKWLAYFSDESGEYALHLRDQSGMGEVKKINLGNPPSFFYDPVWSPDSKKIAYTDKRLNLWYVDIDKGTPVKVDATTYDNPFRVMDPTWSPDSRWITYTKHLKNRMGAIFVYSLEAAKTNQVTDGMSDARYAAFDRSGKYLYFTASTNSGPASGWFEMSNMPHQVTRNVYMVVLRKDLPSPLAPESDEEKPQEGAAQGPRPQEKKPDLVNIDFDNIGQRVLTLPIPSRNFISLKTARAGTIFILEALTQTGAGGPSSALHRFDIDRRKFEKVLDGVGVFAVAANAEKMMLGLGQAVQEDTPLSGHRFVIASTTQPPRPGEGAINTSEMEVRIDPKAEWRQMYHEAWRVHRDFFYDPNYHGIDLKAMVKRYEPYLDAVAHRADLNYLFREMLNNVVVGHMFVGGGDQPQANFVFGGLLGADYKIENGRYRFARIYNGENWNPGAYAPLTQPGVNVQAGEYLLAVGGRDLTASDNIYAFFEGRAAKRVIIRVGPNPDGSGSREVTVIPIWNEFGLRNLAWVEGNRRKVDQMTGGRVAYVYLPDTGGGGYTYFNRYYFSQIDKQAAVIDERFNGGGAFPDYIIDYMRRPLMNYWATREGDDFTTPVGSIYGPKVMIINETAGSGGDALPWYFRKAGIGQLVGKRTVGALVGIYNYPWLIDGGSVQAPRVAFYNLEGEWDVENYGTPPDVEVELDPKAWREGRDSQLEKAVEVVMAELRKNPLPKHRKPGYPNYTTNQNLPEPFKKPARNGKPAGKPR